MAEADWSLVSTGGGETTGEGDGSGGGIVDTVAGVYDFTWGSIDESVSRQVDDEEGGGFVDELDAVLDPTRSASEQTETDVRTGGLLFAPAGGPLGITAFESLFASDTTDAATGQDPPGDVNVPGTETDVPLWPSEDEDVPDAPSPDELTPQWVDWILNHQEEVLVLLVVLVVLYLTGPLAEIAANLSEE